MEGRAAAPQSTIIDMRGKQGARVVTNMEHLNALEKEAELEDAATKMVAVRAGMRRSDRSPSSASKVTATVRDGFQTAEVLAGQREARMAMVHNLQIKNQFRKVRSIVMIPGSPPDRSSTV